MCCTKKKKDGLKEVQFGGGTNTDVPDEIQYIQMTIVMTTLNLKCFDPLVETDKVTKAATFVSWTPSTRFEPLRDDAHSGYFLYMWSVAEPRYRVVLTFNKNPCVAVFFCSADAVQTHADIDGRRLLPHGAVGLRCPFAWCLPVVLFVHSSVLPFVCVWSHVFKLSETVVPERRSCWLCICILCVCVSLTLSVDPCAFFSLCVTVFMRVWLKASLIPVINQRQFPIKCCGVWEEVWLHTRIRIGCVEAELMCGGVFNLHPDIFRSHC